MKLPRWLFRRWTLLWFLAIGVLVAIEIGVITGVINQGDLIGSFFYVLIALMVISFLSIIGAIFVGMWLSHRILATKGFTPFEQEMLRMRQEVRELSEQLEQIATRLGVSPDHRKDEP